MAINRKAERAFEKRYTYISYGTGVEYFIVMNELYEKTNNKKEESMKTDQEILEAVKESITKWETRSSKVLPALKRPFTLLQKRCWNPQDMK